jgi:hypothetical protein
MMAAPPDSLGIWGMFAMSAAGILSTWINRRADSCKDARRHKWDIEDRDYRAALVKKDLEAAKDIVTRRSEDIQKDLATNTAITIAASQKADLAYDAANHVNEKIALLAQRTNDTVQRIDEKQ